MPVHLLNRRTFFKVGAAGLLTFRGVHLQAESASEVDPSLIYILNDAHIGEKHPPNSPVPTHLRLAVEEILSLPRRPAAVLINGDLALKDGQPGDYVHLAALIAPLQQAGVNLHMTLGNHDNREVFFDVLKDQHNRSIAMDSRHISVVQTRHANFFLLDSLKETMVTQGTIGAEQLTWLATALDQHRDRPAIIVAHHNPRLGGDPNHFPGGLIDSAELWDVLTRHRHVKAYVHGHIHDRSNAMHKGIHILNTPATSYVANAKTSTTGWTVARLSLPGIQLTTHTTDPLHPWNREQQRLVWRS